MSSPENDINAAINNDRAIVANAISSTRNHTLNRSAFKLGRIPGMTTDTAIKALLIGARSNGATQHLSRAVTIEKRAAAPYEKAEPGPVSAPTTSGDHTHCAGVPLSEAQSARRTETLTADPRFDQPMASAFPEPVEAIAAADADALAPERDHERLYGPRAAQILRDSRRDVALAPADAKKIAFQEVAKRIGQAVADQWLPKAVMVDWLMEIARAHGSLGLSPDELQNLISDATVEVRILKTPPASAPPKRHLISHRASDIQPERIEWIWPGRLARGKVALLGGPPGLGKSQVTANMAATVSTGGRWPCNEGNALQGDVVILSAEDGIADTIVPRLIAAGADMNRVYIVAAATKLNGTGTSVRKTFSLKTDVDLLEELVRKIGTVRLIIIDPISAYMGGADGNGNVETREVLEPLAEMANRLGIAVVAVTHLNKGGTGGQSPISRFAGSIAFVAAARSAYFVIEDPDDENRRLFLQVKNNLGPKGKGLAFRVEQRLIPGDILASNISWDTDHVTASVDEALIASETRGGGESRSGKDEAADFLRGLLVSGAMPVTVIEQEARDAGLLGPDSPISQNKCFRSARDIVGIVPRRKGGTGANGQWVWELPATPKMPSKPYDAPFIKEGTLDNPGHLSGSEATS
jgi:putative DNA primase/helicase